MENLGNFKSSLLMSAVALSLLSSSANAVSIRDVVNYWEERGGSFQTIEGSTLKRLMILDEAQWAKFKALLIKDSFPSKVRKRY